MRFFFLHSHWWSVIEQKLVCENKRWKPQDSFCIHEKFKGVQTMQWFFCPPFHMPIISTGATFMIEANPLSPHTDTHTDTHTHTHTHTHTITQTCLKSVWASEIEFRSSRKSWSCCSSTPKFKLVHIVISTKLGSWGFFIFQYWKS